MATFRATEPAWLKTEPQPDRRFTAVPEVTLAYIAGLIDGEGTITIRRASRKKGVTEEYAPTISCAQKNPEILHWLKETLGCGAVVAHKFTGDRWGSPIMHHWEVKYDAAYQLIKMLRPFLRIKHQQADLAIEFQDLKRSFSVRRVAGFKGSLSTPPELMAEYRRLCETVQRMNGRKVVHVGPRPQKE